MEWLQAHTAELSALAGSLTAVWTFLRRLDRSYRTQLKETFATKQDFRELRADVRDLRRALVGLERPRRVPRE